MISKIEVLVYIISALGFIYEAFRVKKAKNESDVIGMLFLSFYLLVAEQAFVGGLFNLVHIPIRLISLAVVNIIFCLVLHFLAKRFGVQKYRRVCKVDIIVLLINILLTVVILYKYFGFGLEVTFVSVDGSAHFALAKNIALTHALSNNMYFEAFQGSIWMMLIYPFMSSAIGLTKAFVLSQVVSFFIGVQAFYTLCRTYSDDWKDSILSEVVTIFYALGYFLYAIIYGFAYFAQSMNVIIVIMIITKLYVEKKLEQTSAFVYLNFLLFAVFVCYSLFVPVVFVAVFLTIWFKHMDDKHAFISLQIIKDEVMIFALPCIFGLLYAFSNVKELGDGGGITNEGGCYFDLYSNFLKYLPFMIAGVILVWKKKKYDIVLSMSAITSLFWALLMVMNLKDKASLYYVSKIYNLLWVCGCLLIVICFWEIRRKYVQLLIGGAATLILAGVLLYTPIAQKVIDDNPGYQTVYESATTLFPNIYWFNNVQIGAYHYLQDDKITFFEQAADAYSDGDNNILFVGDLYEQVWYRAIAGDGVAVDVVNVDFDKDLTDDITYVVATSSEDFKKILDDNSEKFDIVYQGDNGYVLAVK